MAYFSAAGHLDALYATVILAVILCAGPHLWKGQGWWWAYRALGVLLIGNELYYQIYLVQAGNWSANNDLPLYLCDVGSVVAGVVRRLLVITVAFTALVGVADVITGGDYMYLRSAPGSGSLLNDMGPWPWYIVSGTVLAWVLLVIFDTPFWFLRRSHAHVPAKGAAA